MRAPAALLCVLLILAGCLSAGTSSIGPTTSCVPDPMPGGEAHDHADPAQHHFACRARLLAVDDLARFGRSDEHPVGAHALDVLGDTLVVAVNGAESDGGQNGFHVFDIGASARDGLEHVGFWDAGQAVNGDRTIALAPDGNTVFLGFEDGARPGIAAVDISDPGRPVEVGFWDDPSGFGPHTISAARIGGQTYVMSLALGVQVLSFEGGEFTMVSRFLTNDEASVLGALGLLDPGAADPAAGAQTFALRSLYGHDMTVYDDPVTGKVLLLVAYAYDGAKIVDITDPRAPVLQASWLPPADTDHPHYTHSMAAERTEDGRLVVVVGSETFEPQNQEIASPVWILDASEAVQAPPRTTAPEHVSTWRNPGGAPAGDLGNSVHFFRMQDGLLYLSHYHGGVWGIDLRDSAARGAAGGPPWFAYAMPLGDDAVRAPEDCCIGFDLDGAPMVFDVAVDSQGDVYTADIIQGVARLRFDRP